MDRNAINSVTAALIRRIGCELGDAAQIARAAATCLEGGNVEQAVKIVMDIEDPAFVADRMLTAILLLRHELLGEVAN